MFTPTDVAKWMLDEVTKDRELSQSDAAWEIEHKFGEEFIYTNDNGNPAISKAVLKEFRKLTEDKVVWEKSSRAWRLRDETDTPGKRQVDYY